MWKKLLVLLVAGAPCLGVHEAALPSGDFLSSATWSFSEEQADPAQEEPQIDPALPGYRPRAKQPVVCILSAFASIGGAQAYPVSHATHTENGFTSSYSFYPLRGPPSI